MHRPACDCCCRLLGKKWSRTWWNWPRLAPESSSSKTSCKPVRRTLSSRCPVLEMSSRMIPWHCKFIPIHSLPLPYISCFFLQYCTLGVGFLCVCVGGATNSHCYSCCFYLNVTMFLNFVFTSCLKTAM